MQFYLGKIYSKMRLILNRELQSFWNPRLEANWFMFFFIQKLSLWIKINHLIKEYSQLSNKLIWIQNFILLSSQTIKQSRKNTTIYFSILASSINRMRRILWLKKRLTQSTWRMWTMEWTTLLYLIILEHLKSLNTLIF